MQASVIFTSNDVIANIGVIIAGGLVYFTNSKFSYLCAALIFFNIPFLYYYVFHPGAFLCCRIDNSC